MTAAELVIPIAGDQQGGRCLDPAAEQSQHVERRLVRPVDVLEHDDRRRTLPELREQGRSDLIWSRPAGAQTGELPTDPRRNIDQRAKRPGGEEGVAGPPKDLGARMLIGEAAQERGLANPSFAGEDAEAARSGDPDVLELTFERGQLTRPLHELWQSGDGNWRSPHLLRGASILREIEHPVKPCRMGELTSLNWGFLPMMAAPSAPSVSHRELANINHQEA